MGWNDRCDVSEIIGKTFIKVERGDEQITFWLDDKSGYKMFHNQDCCESVNIEDVEGDISSLAGSPILVAEENSNSSDTDDGYSSQTWTFYKFATINGHVDIRWYGSSNGYYSESVDFERFS